MASKFDEAVVVSKAESAYTIMLTSLSQYQAQGWEKMAFLDRIRLEGQTFYYVFRSLDCWLRNRARFVLSPTVGSQYVFMLMKYQKSNALNKRNYL